MGVINVWKATSGAAVTTQTEDQTATAAQTLFTLADFTYIVGGNLQVFINGVKQIRGSGEAYTEPSTSTILFTAGLDAGDLVQFINYL